MSINALRAYQRASTETVRPIQLVIMLFEGAIRFVDQAQSAFQTGDIQGIHANLLRAQDILAHLLGTLQEDNEISEQLAPLYIFFHGELVTANVEKDETKLPAVRTFLEQYLDVWRQVDVQTR